MSFTVKRYRSEKEAVDGSWRHSRIVLEPLNPAYELIVVPAEPEGAVLVIAEFLGQLGR
jgi:SOS-response transcriptional repressor LexA